MIFKNNKSEIWYLNKNNINRISTFKKCFLIILNILFISHYANAISNPSSSFQLISSTKHNDKIPVLKYKSNRTGLTVIFGDIEGPDVNGLFLLATETYDDDGLPHTLEHAIFLGSELYPYKGVLDLLANRCLASGTNAWTATDHTCYTLSTAGTEGFLSILPVYLDHILFPTLTDAAFTTEVHHVTGTGEDGGVVYSEMQGRENSGESKVERQMMRAMFPGSSYSSETGGILHNLRTSTTNKKIRDYHATYYRPENLFIIITGQIPHEKVFETLELVEDRVMKKREFLNPQKRVKPFNRQKVRSMFRGAAYRATAYNATANRNYRPKNLYSIISQKRGAELPLFIRPFRTPIAPLDASKEYKVYFASDEEDRGMVEISWRGPINGEAKMHDVMACSILLQYLADTSVSPLQREFVEIEDPYAGRIGGNVQEMMESVLTLSFNNVPIEKVDKIYEKLMTILDKFISKEERIDMVRMNSMIDRDIMGALSAIENYPHDSIANDIISDCLYGDTENEFIYRLHPIKQLELIRTFSESFWVGLIKTYLIDGHHVLVSGIPSIQEQKRSAKEELDRVEMQRKELGEAGLLLKENILLNAKAINDIPPPKEMLLAIEIPTTKDINFHSVKIHRTGVDRNPPGFDFYSLPIYAEAYDARTNFVYLLTTINTVDCPLNLRPYLTLFFNLLTESPIRRENILIPYEKVVAELQTDTVQCSVSLGDPLSYTAKIFIQVEPKKYVKGVRWIIDLLNNSEFEIERIRITAAKMLSDIAERKRHGMSVMMINLNEMIFREDSNMIQNSMLRQHKFLTDLLERLDDPKTAQSVIQNLNDVRSNITNSMNLAIHVGADWDNLSKMGINLNEPWLKIAPKAPIKNGLSIYPDWKTVNFDKKYKNISGSITGLGSSENSYLMMVSPSIKDYMDTDLPALKVFINYLTQTEGPLWKEVRGQGLAYGCNMRLDSSVGLLMFVLYRATNVVSAFKEAKSITEGQLLDNVVWDEQLIESAKSSLVFQIISGEASIGDLIRQSFRASFKKVPIDFNEVLIQHINEVTKEDLLRVGNLYVKSLFSNKAKISIVSHPDKVDEIAAEFKTMGYNLVVDKRLDDSV